jgi:hypothetical protein
VNTPPLLMGDLREKWGCCTVCEAVAKGPRFLRLRLGLPYL